MNQDITQADRERACDILERWGGKDNVQVVHDTQQGMRDHEDGYAGELVRAFRDHRLAAIAHNDIDEGTTT